MSVYIDVPLYIQYGNISQYLAAVDKSQKMLLQGGALAEDLPWLLEVVTEGLEWQYNLNPNEPSLNEVGLFLLALCGKYRIEAQRILGNGQAGQVINPSTGTTITIANPAIQFTVGDGGAPMNTGDTVLTLTYSNVVNPSIEVFLDGVELPYGLGDRISYTATYNPTNIVITFNQGVVSSQVYRVRFLQLINVGIPASLGVETVVGGIFIGDL